MSVQLRARNGLLGTMMTLIMKTLGVLAKNLSLIFFKPFQVHTDMYALQTWLSFDG